MAKEGYLLKITDLVMNESRIEQGAYGMPKVFSTITDLVNYAKRRLRPQTFGKDDSRFKVEAIDIEIIEKDPHVIII